MRPKNSDSAVTWDLIVMAARRQLVDNEHGGLDLSIRSVSTSADVSLGTIHYYFPTKEALLEACLDAYYEDLETLARELMQSLLTATRENAKETLDGCLRRIYRFAVSERPRLRLRARTNASRGMLHPDRHARVRGPYLDAFTPILARIVDLDPLAIRLTFQTITFAVMQYVLLCDEELEQIAGVGGDEGRRVIEDHVVHTTLRVLFTS